MKTTFGGRISGLQDIEIQENKTNNSLILNVNGTTYNLDTESEEKLFNSIKLALLQIGSTGLN
jgi:hypothetical protein